MSHCNKLFICKEFICEIDQYAADIFAVLHFSRIAVDSSENAQLSTHLNLANG